MALAVVQHVGVQGNNVTSITTAAITTTSGNGIVRTEAFFAGGFVSVSDSKGNTYVQTGTEQTEASAALAVRQYRHLNITGGASHTFTLTLSAADFPSIGVTEFSGQDTVGFDKTAQGTSTGVTHASPATATTTQADEILFGSLVYQPTFAPPDELAVAGGFTVGYIADGIIGGMTAIGHEFKIVSATGAYASAFTTVNSVDAGNIIGTYKASGGAPPPNTPVTLGRFDPELIAKSWF